MSIAARALPLTRPVAPRRHLRALPSPTPMRNQVASRIQSGSLTRVQIGRRVAVAMLGLIILNLIVIALNSASVYAISGLKRESAQLATQTQIVQQQIDSLRSPQNLANSARSLGMIVNSNPVFLKVADGKVLGKAVPASYSQTGAISTNLIANAALISKSNPTKVTKSKMDIPTTQSVKTVSSSPTKVVLPSGGIPASPTH